MDVLTRPHLKSGAAEGGLLTWAFDAIAADEAQFHFQIANCTITNNRYPEKGAVTTWSLVGGVLALQFGSPPRRILRCFMDNAVV